MTAKVKSHQHEVTVASNAFSWERPCLGTACTRLKAPLHQYVVHLTLVLPIWVVPNPSSGCLVLAKGVSQNEVVVAGEFQEPEASLV